MTKLPAFQFYPGDWRKDPAVQSLDYECRGVWIELLCLMHESSERGKIVIHNRAATDDEIARMLGLSPEIAKQILSKLEANGVAKRCPNTGALMNARMVRDQEIRDAKVEAGRAGGLAKAKQTPSKPPSKSQANRGSSVSSSVSSSSTTTSTTVPRKSSASGSVTDVDTIVEALNTIRVEAGLQQLRGGDKAGRRYVSARLREYGLDLVLQVTRWAPQDPWIQEGPRFALAPLYSPKSFPLLLDRMENHGTNGVGPGGLTAADRRLLGHRERLEGVEL